MKMESLRIYKNMDALVKKTEAMVDTFRLWCIAKLDLIIDNNKSGDNGTASEATAEVSNDSYTVYWNGKTKYSDNIKKEFVCYTEAMNEYNRHAKKKGNSYVELIAHKSDGSIDSLARFLNQWAFHYKRG